jgi:hypothetical protein
MENRKRVSSTHPSTASLLGQWRSRSCRDDHGIPAAGGAGCRILGAEERGFGYHCLGIRGIGIPDSMLIPLRWILWSLFSDISVVVMAAADGASLDRWTVWVKAPLRGFYPI